MFFIFLMHLSVFFFFLLFLNVPPFFYDLISSIYSFERYGAIVMDDQYDDGSLGYTVLHNSTCQHAAPTYINLMNSAILRLATEKENMKIQTRNHPLPMSRSQHSQHHVCYTFLSHYIVYSYLLKFRISTHFMFFWKNTLCFLFARNYFMENDYFVVVFPWL